jgi:hypothetical protein
MLRGKKSSKCMFLQENINLHFTRQLLVDIEDSAITVVFRLNICVRIKDMTQYLSYQ